MKGLESAYQDEPQDGKSKSVNNFSIAEIRRWPQFCRPPWRNAWMSRNAGRPALNQLEVFAKQTIRNLDEVVTQSLSPQR